jgi:phosphoribosyl-dephospho-CoA transferase
MTYRDVQSVRTHDLLEIDAKPFIDCNASVPEWVVENLQRTPFVVARRGQALKRRIPVGIRGSDRSQRWATICPQRLVKKILPPPRLLMRSASKSREDAIPAFRALNLIKERWRDLDFFWGPGGSVGFELATGRHVVKPESDLDIVIYAKRRITREEARSLYARTMNLSVAVDIRVETLTCGFSLAEYARGGSAGILLRTPDGLELSNDPWSYEFSMEDRGRGVGERQNVL